MYNTKKNPKKIQLRTLYEPRSCSYKSM